MFTHALPYTGSSPLARGTHRFHEHRDQQCRFIPARAGNTCCRRSAHRSSPVHPRSRGEHGRDPGESWLAAGSSPLARGTRDQGDGEDQGLRFIPARAGNTKVVCPVVWLVYGSSPLARGTLRERHRAGPHGRFIPARAGNTANRRHRSATSTVHPRSRGEHQRPSVLTGLTRGSSPLARGTQRYRCRLALGFRFIPARAGNTSQHVFRALDRAVHPRSRGEHVSVNLDAIGAGGSSPLARGTPDSQRRQPLKRRFIPARAGNTERVEKILGMELVHPRSRGEHPEMPLVCKPSAGSSPLARGTLVVEAGEPDFRRFIPARAGNTSRMPRLRGCEAVHPRSRGEHFAN